jgi:hypothetical protein
LSLKFPRQLVPRNLGLDDSNTWGLMIPEIVRIGEAGDLNGKWIGIFCGVWKIKVFGLVSISPLSKIRFA